MKKITRSDRGVALLLSLCVLFSNLVWPALAIAADDVSAFCEHHSAHTEDCGYVAGEPCTHEHDEGCYVLQCVHEHTMECYFADLPMGYEHAEDEPSELISDEEELRETEEQEALLQEAAEEETGAVEEESFEEEPLKDEPSDTVLDAKLEFEFAIDESQEDEPQDDELLDADFCAHEHGNDCYVLSCAHEHDEGCGYVEGHPCEFVCEICRPAVLALSREAMPLELGDDEILIAEIDFENGYVDESGNGVAVELLSGDGNNLQTDEKGKYLDLSRNNAYLSLKPGILSGLVGITVEMDIKWSHSGGSGSRWAFYAAPDGYSPDSGRYAAVVFNEDSNPGNVVTAQQQRGGWQPENRFNATASWPNDNAWHNIKVVFDEQIIIIYIDGNEFFNQPGKFNLAECIGANGVIWFGGAAWGGNNGRPGQFFDGAIDNIRITGKEAPPPDLSQYEPFIITDGVVDPDDTVVNFFDYWTNMGQYGNDFRAMNGFNGVLNGINVNHVLLFAGYFGLTGDTSPNNGSDSGYWNAWTGDNGSDGMGGNYNGFDPNNPQNPRFKPYQGIVARRLDSNGYPVLNLSNERTPSSNNGTWNNLVRDSSKRTESLQYLFDPEYEHNGKASYLNAKGLFQMDAEGYYYYDSKEAFAELNIDQPWGGKESKKVRDANGKMVDQNQITLFNRPWQYAGNTYSGNAATADNNARLQDGRGELNQGQFFPFNHWGDLFSVNGTAATQNHYYLQSQAETSQSMDHYFGMTVTTKFQQPMDGMITPGNPMKFRFSGDDDVWIFIDGVLVGDIGGIHLPDGIEIDFSTGAITYTALNVTDRDNTITHMNSTIWAEFNKAGADGDLTWNGNTFANGSIHELKFYYMERGNDVSNCSISFNFDPILKDRIRKINEDGDPLKTAKFDLYRADKNDATYNDDNTWHYADEFKIITDQNGKRLVAGNLVGGDDGYYDIVDDSGNPIDLTVYGDNAYFILDESTTPAGYRLNKYIVLQYHLSTNTFTVVNKYETGAYASFAASWRQYNEAVNVAEYDPINGLFMEGAWFNKKANAEEMDNEKMKKGLAIVVPVFKQTADLNSEGDFLRWIPMYGSNTLGWQTITESFQDKAAVASNETNFVRDLALAAFLQMAETNYRDWYLSWNEITDRLSGYMENLPGEASRYVINNPREGDLNLVTLFISGEELAALLSGTEPPEFKDDDERYYYLKSALQTRLADKRLELGASATDEQVAKAVLQDVFTYLDDKYTGKDPFTILYSGDFARKYRTALYVPNERRELRVRKIDSNTSEGTRYIDGAVFAIFNDYKDAAKFPAKDNVIGKEYETKSEALAALGAAGSKVRSYGETATVKLDTSTDGYQEGLLVFREDMADADGKGYAHIVWPSDRANTNEPVVLWLKEIYTPDGYERNNNLVRIEVGDLAIYANATGYNERGELLTGYAKTTDGIKVYAALGKLTQTLVKYALNNNVDITLRDIMITKQIGKMKTDGALNEEVRDTWTDSSNDTFDLHYGLWSEVLTSQYGQHAYEQQLPTFDTEDGYIRIMPRQSQKNFRTDGSYYNELGTELYNQLREAAIDEAEEEAGRALTQEEITAIETWVNNRVYGGNGEKGIIPELKELHSYNARMDTLTNNGDPIDLDGLFGLMNIVEVKNTVIPVSLKISKEVPGPGKLGDKYTFKITLSATTESGVWNDPNSVDGEYHAYIHRTDHQVPLLDQHGNRIPVTDPITGEEIVDENGNTVYQTRACGPGDHTHDAKAANDEGYDHVHLIVTGGVGKIRNMATNDIYDLELKGGETLAVVGLPQGAKFTVEEEIYSPLGTKYRVDATRKGDMRPYGDGSDYIYGEDTSVNRPKPDSDKPEENPDIEVTVFSGREWADDGLENKPLTVSGFLQTSRYAWDAEHAPNYSDSIDNPEFADIVIPPAEVRFINADASGLPETGYRAPDILYWLFGITFLIGVSLIFYMEHRRAANN